MSCYHISLLSFQCVTLSFFSDIDECVTPSRCSQHEIYINFPGGFKCTCAERHYGLGCGSGERNVKKYNLFYNFLLFFWLCFMESWELRMHNKTSSSQHTVIRWHLLFFVLFSFWRQYRPCVSTRWLIGSCAKELRQKLGFRQSRVDAVQRFRGRRPR